jgi:hypothetical protein
MTVYRIIATMVAAGAIPFILLGRVFSGRPTLQGPCITIAANLYTRALFLLTPEERAQYAKKLADTAAEARQKGKPTADLLDAFTAVAVAACSVAA